MDTFIPSAITESDLFKERALALAIRYPQAFVVRPAYHKQPEGNGTWASYAFDGNVMIWINTSHPNAIELYQEVLTEKKEAIMSQALTVIEKKNVYSMLKTNIMGIKSVISETLKPEKVMRLSYQIVVKNPDLARKCTPESLMNSILEAASLNLEVGGPMGLAHILPYKGVAELRIDYKGEIELMYRSPLVKKVVVQAVYENDLFEYEYGTDQYLKHRPAGSKVVGMVRLQKGKLVAAYCMVFFTNGDSNFVVCDQEMADYAKSCSDAKNSKYSPWNKPGEVHWMWIKTAVHRMAKTIPMSPELQRAINLNQSADAGKPQETQIDAAIDAEFTEMQETYTAIEETEAERSDVTPAPAPDPNPAIEGQTPKPGSMKPGAEPVNEIPAAVLFDGELASKDEAIMNNLKAVMDGFPEVFSQARLLCVARNKEGVPFYEVIDPPMAEMIMQKMRELIDTENQS